MSSFFALAHRLQTTQCSAYGTFTDLVIWMRVQSEGED